MQALPDKATETLAQACEQAAILVSLGNLMTYPWIRSRVEAGKLLLLGWYFDMINGELLQYEPDSGEFRVLVPHEGIGKSTEHVWWRAPG